MIYDIYEEALMYAIKKHKNQFRKGKIIKPYIEHPIAVSKLVEEYMMGDIEKEKYKIAALLHDTLEDTDATYDEEKKLFGDEIADIVLRLTNDKDKIKKYGKNIYLANKLLNMEDKTLTLKLCDRLDNVKDLLIGDNDFVKKYMQETTFILNCLLLNRSLGQTHLKLINEIMLMETKVAGISKLEMRPKKKILKIE